MVGLGLTCLTACSLLGYEHHTPIGHVELFPVAGTSTAEIRVLYKVSGRGNVHDPFTYRKWEFVSSDWVVIDMRDGVSVLDGKRLMPCPDGYNLYYSGTQVTGTVDIQGNSIQISLSVPSQDHPGWAAYQFNGTWPLLVETTPPPIEARDSETGHDCKPGRL